MDLASVPGLRDIIAAARSRIALAGAMINDEANPGVADKMRNDLQAASAQLELALRRLDTAVRRR